VHIHTLLESYSLSRCRQFHMVPNEQLQLTPYCNAALCAVGLARRG
jgi:hypothetical protein